jgi:hypothetical protein
MSSDSFGYCRMGNLRKRIVNGSEYIKRLSDGIGDESDF